MTIDEAIKILRSEQEHGVITNMDNWNDAIKLGIEALKGIKEVREHHLYLRAFPLPGETEEVK